MTKQKSKPWMQWRRNEARRANPKADNGPRYIPILVAQENALVELYPSTELKEDFGGK